MARSERIDIGTAVNVTYKLVRILIEHELESGRLAPRRLRQLAAIVEDRAHDSRDARDVQAASLLREVIEATIATADRVKTRPN